ncbi:pilus assembly protein PilN [Litchfieldella qijiaojingensis]|uniref:Pilus assembly protein PilN n=1 Tax=Litchfieldella qijiaojingensis TaxID=980347 RepID=A0ABQ2YXN0_9GAMM|nr:PilN domain-containing protein [Halomonas qijiaojingensis]GGX97287.1 pilus assembly protein PilN [Halomonas qijiaojingensis]
MTIEINLLPWREHVRERHRKRFYLLLILTFAVGLTGGAGMAYHSHQQLTAQQQRNDHIQRQMVRLDDSILSIIEYEGMRDRMLARIGAFARLQHERAQTVRLFNHLAENLEQGVHYTRLSRQGDTVLLVGLVENNHQVSDQLRALAKTTVLEIPVLLEVESEAGQHLRRFSLSVAQPPPAGEEAR